MFKFSLKCLSFDSRLMNLIISTILFLISTYNTESLFLPNKEKKGINKKSKVNKLTYDISKNYENKR